MQNQVPRDRHTSSNLVDDSEGSFCAYLAKENERIKRVESHRADAHEVLIFVCSRLARAPSPAFSCERPLGCPACSHSCDTYWRIYPGPPTRPSRQMGILSRENLRTARRHERAPRFPPFDDPHRSRQFFPGDIDHLDQLVLVSEPGRQSDVYPDRHVVAAMDISI